MTSGASFSTVREEDVSFSRDGLVLRGTVSLSVDSGEAQNQNIKHGIITLHGWGGNRSGPHRMMALMGRELAAWGAVALRFDLHGRGFSDGDAQTADLDGMIADTVAAAEFLKDTYGVQKISLVGICSGGNVAIGAETLLRGSVDRLVCLSTLPFAPPPRGRSLAKAAGYLKVYFKKACSLSTWKRLIKGEASIGGAARVVGRAAAGDSDRNLKDSKRNIMTEFAETEVQLLFIYGSNDPEAPQACEHYRDFCSRNKITATFSEIEGANHNYYSAEWSRQVRELTVGFIVDGTAF